MGTCPALYQKAKHTGFDGSCSLICQEPGRWIPLVSNSNDSQMLHDDHRGAAPWLVPSPSPGSLESLPFSHELQTIPSSPWSLSWFPGAPWKPKPWAYNQLVISRNSCLEAIWRTGFHVLTAGSSHRKHLWKGSKSLRVPPMEARFSCLPYDIVISFRPQCWIHSFKSAEWNIISMQAFHSLLRTQRLIRHVLCY